VREVSRPFTRLRVRGALTVDAASCCRHTGTAHLGCPRVAAARRDPHDSPPIHALPSASVFLPHPQPHSEHSAKKPFGTVAPWGEALRWPSCADLPLASSSSGHGTKSHLQRLARTRPARVRGGGGGCTPREQLRPGVTSEPRTVSRASANGDAGTLDGDEEVEVLASSGEQDANDVALRVDAVAAMQPRHRAFVPTLGQGSRSRASIDHRRARPYPSDTSGCLQGTPPATAAGGLVPEAAPCMRRESVLSVTSTNPAAAYSLGGTMYAQGKRSAGRLGHYSPALSRWIPAPVRRQIPALQFAMFDSVTLAEIPVGAVAVAGYVNGHWPTFSELTKSWPHARRLSIAVSADTDAHCLDVEQGDATVAEAAAWVRRQLARGVKRPVVYCSVSTARELIHALGVAGIARRQIRLWTAHYTNHPHRCSAACGFGMPTNADATQWTSNSQGRNLDESLCAPDFL
jgi:hypothetical protein